MGHWRLGNPPRTRRWNQLVELLTDGESQFDEIADQSLRAVELGLKNAATDFGLQTAFWLLVQIADSAKRDRFRERLWKCGLTIPDAATPADLTSSFALAVQDKIVRAGRQSDVGDIALASATETLTKCVSETTRDLFDSAPKRVDKSLEKFAGKSGFASLGKEFFSSFSARYLGYLLSRELSNHVGGNNRFRSIANHNEFNKALGLHCRQASRIVEDFSGGWFSKHAWQGKLSLNDVSGFLHVAFKKLRAEFRRGGSRG